MRHYNSKRLFTYWNKVRNGRTAPLRKEIEPSDIRELLGDTFILDVSNSLKTISYRLAGTRLCAAYGRELKGLGFLVPWDEQDCFEVTKTLTKVYRDHEPQIACSIAKTDSGKTIEFETIFLPLQPVDEQNFRIIGLTSPNKTPFWLGADPITSNKLRSVRAIKDAGTDIFGDATLAPSLKNQDVFSSEMKETPGQRKVAHLIVHEGGKLD